MRHLRRLSIPTILENKHEEWTKKFLEKKTTHPKLRPDNSKYAHKDIVEKLHSISSHKCFYSEELLKENYKEIDHYIEVDEEPDLAYSWDNLYLSSEICNNKLPNKDIPTTETLNPFINNDQQIEENLYFEDEYILSNTILGEKTISKFRLDNEKLDNKRRKVLQKFHQQFLEIKDELIKDGRSYYSEEELKKLQRFAHFSSPFSLMFKYTLKKHNLL
ncbi:hypothetical protein [Chryseobacterium sp. Marseille-Q3244]|uniref:hypothetical protein n=1 Tax=Chryseobacterium sp. Marseille-Q3244 TaxID=2758092 RepID=UPI002024888F|nr:hypothetical protein [Chryseobacterium sp. Marseille-Q3244]